LKTRRVDYLNTGVAWLIVRMRSPSFSAEEIRVPIPQHSLTHVREIAEHSRKRVIPQISKI